MAGNLRFHLLILFFSFAICKCTADSECIYAIYVQIGPVARAGTHSTIGLTLSDQSGSQIEIPNLEEWGLMGPGYNYFEKGYLDIFGGKGPCLNGPICGLTLTSDGSGPYAGWYCDYVEVAVIGVQKQCSQQHFAVEQWLATDQPPYKLTAVKDVCSSVNKKRGINGLGLSLLMSK